MSPALALLAVSLAVTESAFSCTYGSHTLAQDTICLGDAPRIHQLVCEIGGKKTKLETVRENKSVSCSGTCWWQKEDRCYAVPKGACRGGRYLVYNLTDGKPESAICTEVPSSAAAPATRHEATPGSPRRVPSSTATPATKDPPGLLTTQPNSTTTPKSSTNQTRILTTPAMYNGTTDSEGSVLMTVWDWFAVGVCVGLGVAVIAVVVVIVLRKRGECKLCGRDVADTENQAVPGGTNPQGARVMNGQEGGGGLTFPLLDVAIARNLNPESTSEMREQLGAGNGPHDPVWNCLRRARAALVRLLPSKGPTNANQL